MKLQRISAVSAFALMIAAPALAQESVEDVRADFLEFCASGDAEGERVCDCAFERWSGELEDPADPANVGAIKLMSGMADGDMPDGDMDQMLQSVDALSIAVVDCSFEVSALEAPDDEDVADLDIDMDADEPEAPEPVGNDGDEDEDEGYSALDLTNPDNLKALLMDSGLSEAEAEARVAASGLVAAAEDEADVAAEDAVDMVSEEIEDVADDMSEVEIDEPFEDVEIDDLVDDTDQPEEDAPSDLTDIGDATYQALFDDIMDQGIVNAPISDYLALNTAFCLEYEGASEAECACQQDKLVATLDGRDTPAARMAAFAASAEPGDTPGVSEDVFDAGLDIYFEYLEAAEACYE